MSQIIQRMRDGVLALGVAFETMLLRTTARLQARGGQSTLEWALIALLIAVAAYAAYRFLGDQLSTKVSSVGSQVGGT